MTEAEWLAATELDWLNGAEILGKVSDRKHRLFAVACCRRVWSVMPDELSRRAVETAELFADGQATENDLRKVVEEFEKEFESEERATQRLSASKRWCSAAAFVCCTQYHERLASEAAYHCNEAVRGLDNPRRQRSNLSEEHAQCDLFRDLFQPFRPVTFSLTWRTDTALSLAQQMYESRDFFAMPILADALQDAGCDNDDILNHCRGDGPHVRGCWVVDLVLGKE